jgi:hypothetical protein
VNIFGCTVGSLLREQIAGPINSAAWRAAEVPSANAHGTARVYAALAAGGALDGTVIVAAAALAKPPHPCPGRCRICVPVTAGHATSGPHQKRSRWQGDARQPVVQGRSFSGLRTTQMCLIRSPATSNAKTVTVQPSC